MPASSTTYTDRNVSRGPRPSLERLNRHTEMQSSPKLRIVSILLYAAVLSAVQFYVVKTGFLPNENSIWLFSGFASLLLGTRMLNPYFTPPADAATNAFASLASLIVAGLVVTEGTADAYVLIAAATACALVLLLAVAILIVRPPLGAASPLPVRALDTLVRQLGSPNVIFTLVILVAVWLFHRTRPVEVFAILASWAVIAAIRPLEAIFDYFGWLRAQFNPASREPIVGTVAAYQTPNIAVIRQSASAPVALGTTLLVPGEQGVWLLGVALNYVGRDEGNLLRALTATLPATLAGFAKGRISPSAGVALPLVVPADQVADIPALQWVNRLCGIVDSDTTFEFLRFEVIDEQGLSEGRLVEARIGDFRSVLFQLIEGVTHEEVVQQKNKYGYARAKARKIGRWDAEARQFRHVPWLPNLNAPVFLLEDAAFEPNAADIGHFPRTSYGVSLNMHEAVTHNTAILGILGIGKTYLSVEMVERMIASGTKVLCLDLTNQYATLLSEFVDPAYDDAANKALQVAGAGGKAHKNKEEGGSRKAFKQAVADHLADFMTPGNGRFLRVLNPAQFEVTRQGTNMFSGDADLTTLTPCEITAIFSDAALAVCQQQGMTDAARLCLVYEEAHSLVPEWNSVASEGDRTATSVSARAILQGRKYGLGCLLITQRTANVTKTILNQCNTIIAMRTFDDTGKDFLSNYIGADYAGVLPTLEARHAVVFGKASSCENPVLVRLNDRAAFLGAFRAEHAPPPVGPPQPEPAEPEAMLEHDLDAGLGVALDDDIPF